MYVVDVSQIRDGKRVLEQFDMVLVRMFKYRSDNYIRCMTTYKLWLTYTKTKNPELYEWIVNNIDALDEERGELSLAQLRECTLRDTDQANCDKLSVNYGMLPLVSEVIDDLKTG